MSFVIADATSRMIGHCFSLESLRMSGKRLQNRLHRYEWNGRSSSGSTTVIWMRRIEITQYSDTTSAVFMLNWGRSSEPAKVRMTQTTAVKRARIELLRIWRSTKWHKTMFASHPIATIGEVDQVLPHPFHGNGRVKCQQNQSQVSIALRFLCQKRLLPSSVGNFRTAPHEYLFHCKTSICLAHSSILFDVWALPLKWS